MASKGSRKNVRKPYTITKSRENWKEEEHKKFLEALQLFDRDWKKIEEFVGSKTVIQIRSHAQKYFLKVQKNGTAAHVPPPRLKRTASHPYLQKASTNVNAGATYMRVNSHEAHDSNSKGSSSRSFSNFQMPKLGNQGSLCNGIPDFAKVYTFIGDVFDPNSTSHMQKLKEMNPTEVETAILLMRNLTINLSSVGSDQLVGVLFNSQSMIHGHEKTHNFNNGNSDGVNGCTKKPRKEVWCHHNSQAPNYMESTASESLGAALRNSKNFMGQNGINFQFGDDIHVGNHILNK